MQLMAVEIFIYLFAVFIFNYEAVCLCKRQGISKNSNTSLLPQHFGLIFGVLFCLIINKLLLGSKTIWQSMRKFPCAVLSVRTFSYMDKNEIFFLLKNTHWWGLIFLDNYLFKRNSNFSKTKDINFRCVQMIYTPFESYLLSAICQRFCNIIAR